MIYINKKKEPIKKYIDKHLFSISFVCVSDIVFCQDRVDHDAGESAVKFIINHLNWIINFSIFSDLARERNLKNQKGKGQSVAETEANKGLSLQERQARDAAKYRN
jgi:hypothetical protein